MPPTIFEGGNVNMFQPYVVGQSGTDKPESVLVTKLPARIRRTVLATTRRQYLWSISAGWSGTSGGPGRRLTYLSDPSGLPDARPSVRWSWSRRRLEGERDFLCFLRTDRHLLRRRPELFVPRFDRVGAGRQRLDVEFPVLVAHREVRMVEHADVRVHPAVHVALERHHDFLRGEGVGHLHALNRLAVVELLVRLRHRVNVVQRRIAVDDLERLTDAHPEHVRMIAAVLLIDRRFVGRRVVRVVAEP